MTSWRRHEKQVQSDLKEEMAKAKDFDAGAKKVVAEDILDATRRLLSDELATRKKAPRRSPKVRQQPSQRYQGRKRTPIKA